jgi:replicative DNA helicase
MRVLDQAIQSVAVPPQNLEAERSILASLMLDGQSIEKAMEILNCDDFYTLVHQKIFDAMIALHKRNEPIDLITLTNYLEKDGTLDSIGGFMYLSELISEVPTAVNVEYHSKIVKEKSVHRNLIKAAADIIDMCQTRNYDLDYLLDRAEQRIFAVTEKRSKPSFIKLKDVLKETIKQVEGLYHKKELITGTPTGFLDLDVDTTGFQPGDLIILGARPSMGKTAFCLNIAQHVGINIKKPVAIFSLEMSKEQVAMRMLCSEAEVDAKKIRSGYFSKDEWVRIIDAAARLSGAEIYIDDSDNTVLEVRSKARRLKIEHGLGLIVIDYLQLMGGTKGRGMDSREREIAEISRSLKALAKELSVPVVALSQLNRGVEARTDKHPNLADLRESGAIEQDADVILFLYRDEYYNPQSPHKGIAELDIAKQRNGPAGITKKFTFIHRYAKFKSYSDREMIVEE